MNLWILIALEIIFLVLSYILLDGDYFAPPVMTIAVVLIGTMMVIPSYQLWNVSISSQTIAVIATGFVCCCVGGCIAKQIISASKIQSKRIECTSIHWHKSMESTALFITILLTLLYMYDALRIGHLYGGSGFGAIGYMKAAYMSGSQGPKMNALIRQGFKVVMALAYISTYYFVNNVLIMKEKVRKNLTYLISFVCGCVITIFSGSRTEILRLVSALILDYVVLTRLNSGYNSSKNKIGMDKNLVVSIHVQSVDQLKAIKLIKGKITDLDRMKIEEQKKAVRSGYDMEIIPSDLATYGGEAKKILDDLQSRNERMFLVTVLFLNTAKTKQELDSAVFQTAGIAQKFNCTLNRLDYLQEQGLMSSLPLANNLVPIKRALTTTSTAIFVPFTTQELFMEGDSLYYGLNAVSNNMIMADRKQLKNPNGLILGTPGSGKSFSAKREITNVFFTTTDDIIVADPEGEYYPLVEALGGQVIHISSTSRDYINPMDINLNYADDDNPLGMKSDFILSLCELIMGARDGMEPEEKSVIDRCLPLVYQKYLNDPKPENMPTLGDLYDCLREQKERQAQRIATALEIYVNGSLRVFNHQTNVELDNRIICFDIKELGKQLKKLGMLIVQDQVWNRVTINRNSKKNTRYYIDEFHLLLKEEQTAAYSVEIWKRFRKWGGIPTGITQNIKDLLASREIENIFENSDFIYMLNQASGDRQILAKQLNISPFQLSYVTNSNEGEGLLFYGNTIIPFKDKFDTSLKLYGLMTTKPMEMGKHKEKKEA